MTIEPTPAVKALQAQIAATENWIKENLPDCEPEPEKDVEIKSEEQWICVLRRRLDYLLFIIACQGDPFCCDLAYFTYCHLVVLC